MRSVLRYAMAYVFPSSVSNQALGHPNDHPFIFIPVLESDTTSQQSNEMMGCAGFR